MRDVATRTDDDLPLRQSQISVIRSVLGQQFVFPDEAAADEGDICALPTLYNCLHNHYDNHCQRYGNDINHSLNNGKLYRHFHDNFGEHVHSYSHHVR
ncbi:hypothetical protein IWW39_004979 [Coemansia spiralis]|uniref:Uncharacterized protein n=1 Tax=Coemansia spiralis TaxID=417178 RepID=A0A9W8GAU5_9FUNG|nr:hypothetical protein IWW39_004979 [Coemansia spiralis]